jgi:hypothetical protein
MVLDGVRFPYGPRSTRGGVDVLPTQKGRNRIMSNNEDMAADWGIEFIAKVDEKLQEPGYEETLEFWKDGDFGEAFEVLSKLYPEVTEDQWTWVEEFLSEI